MAKARPFLIACAVLLLTAGVVSVFTERNGVGSAATLAAGLVIGLLGIGYDLKSLRARGWELVLDRAGERFASGDEEGAIEILTEKVKTAPTSLFGPTAADYEATVSRLIRSAVPAQVGVAQPQSPREAAFDLILYGARGGGLNLGIDVRGGVAFDPNAMIDRYATALTADVLDLGGMVVVVNSSDETALETAQERIRMRLAPLVGLDEGRIRVLGWRPEDPPSSLTDPLVALLQLDAEQGGAG